MHATNTRRDKGFSKWDYTNRENRNLISHDNFNNRVLNGNAPRFRPRVNFALSLTARANSETHVRPRFEQELNNLTYTPTIVTSNGPCSVQRRPEQPTSVTYRSSSPGGVSGAKHLHQIFSHWVPSPGGISLSSPPVCSSVVSSPTATSIAHPRSCSEDDIAQKEDIPFPRCCLPFSGTTYFNKSFICNECSIKL